MRDAVEHSQDLSDTKLKDTIRALGGRVASAKKKAADVSEESAMEEKMELRGAYIGQVITLLRDKYKNDLQQVALYLQDTKAKKKGGFGTKSK